MANIILRKNADDYSHTLFPEYMRETEPLVPKRQTQPHADPFHLGWLEGMTRTDFDMPVIEPYNGALPTSLLPFHEARANYYKHTTLSGCPHFYIDDSYFTCLLNDLPKYTTMLAGFPAVIGPDFSLKIDMDDPLKMYNSYINKMATRYFQLHGVKAIPNVVWADPKSYDYCFAGYPENSIVAINSMGIKGNRQSVFFWLKGYEEMINKLRPTHIMRYGPIINGEDENISTYYTNNHLNRMRHGR